MTIGKKKRLKPIVPGSEHDSQLKMNGLHE